MHLSAQSPEVLEGTEPGCAVSLRNGKEELSILGLFLEELWKGENQPQR